ncbi:MAG: sugar phosphate isomerase/epimerase [Candidatus Omnitrophica bacterium]|nr:sugar phosphate isomerase/epimerase [Candidatus Omnitrophota bacterium]
MGLVLSTSWNAHRHTDAKRMLAEIAELGFDGVELSFNLTRSMVRTIERLVKRSSLRVVSVHNFCPIPDRVIRPMALPDCISLSSDDESERREAVRYAKRSVDTALSVRAHCVVLHCGRVAVADRTPELCSLYEEGLKDSDEFVRIRDQMIEERRRRAPKFLESVMRSLGELENYARGRNVALGVETRFYHREIPSFNELGLILNAFKGAGVYYWHDTGHAQVTETLGFASHKDFLERYQRSLLGVHLHDVSGCRDHKVPSFGSYDFAMLLPYLSKATHKVMEVHRPAEAEDIRKGKAFLEGVFDGIL